MTRLDFCLAHAAFARREAEAAPAGGFRERAEAAEAAWLRRAASGSLREAHVPGVDAQPQPHAEPHRDQHHVAAAQIARVESADHIGIALRARIAAEQALAVVEIVDEDEDLRGRCARVEPDRRPGPVDVAVPFDPVPHHPRSVAQPEDEGAARLLARNIGDGLALVAEDALEDSGEALGAVAEQILAASKMSRRGIVSPAGAAAASVPFAGASRP
jgi:hypothetical protein